MATPSLCGGVLSSRRGLLASLWSLIIILTAVAFLTASIFTLSAKDNSEEYNYYAYENNGEQQQQQQEEQEAEIAVTSRAMAFAALWTAVLATLLAISGTVVLGLQSPTGQYYTCCSPAVHRTTPIALGSFIGALFMFANLTLVCSALFGEFQIRDYVYRDGEENRDDQNDRSTAVSRSSLAFSIMCMFLTVIYAGFAALTFAFSTSVMEEFDEEERLEAMTNSRTGAPHFSAGATYNNGYIGERFDVRRGKGFVSPKPPEGTLT